MKNLLILSAAFLLSIGAHAQSEKVIVDSGGTPLGRYIRTNGDTYTGFAQDDFTVPKAGHKVVTYSAEAGQGMLTCKDFGTVNVRITPSTDGTIIGRMIYEEGDIPECYPCLGKQWGWYKVRINNRVGYVRQDLVTWSAFCAD